MGGDFDEDGVMDFALACGDLGSSESGVAVIYTGDGNGRFEQAAIIDITHGGGRILARDFNLE